MVEEVPQIVQLAEHTLVGEKGEQQRVARYGESVGMPKKRKNAAHLV